MGGLAKIVSTRKTGILRRNESNEPKASATDHEPKASATDHEPKASATDHEPKASATDHEPKASATDHEPKASATDVALSGADAFGSWRLLVSQHAAELVFVFGMAAPEYLAGAVEQYQRRITTDLKTILQRSRLCGRLNHDQIVQTVG